MMLGKGQMKSPAAFLERIMAAFRRVTAYDPEAAGHKATIAMFFMAQAVPDIRWKLQSLDELQGKSLRDLVTVAAKCRGKTNECQPEIPERHGNNDGQSAPSCHLQARRSQAPETDDTQPRR